MTKSGIILADMGDKQRPEQGEVIAIGPGRLLDSGIARADVAQSW
jgi:co-chaperonin GroES (HSP10)